MMAKEFQKICKNLFNVDRILQIQCQKKIIIFETHCMLIDGEIIYESNKDVNIECKNTITQSISLNNLVLFIQSAYLTDKIKICMDKERPLKLQLDFGNSIVCEYYVCPQINN